MFELAIVAVAMISAIFILALTALLLGRKLSFKLSLGWKAANCEFAASEQWASTSAHKTRNNLRLVETGDMITPPTDSAGPR